MKTEYEEKIEELDAIINLYKDDAADGLRNKIWAWASTLIQESNAESFWAGAEMQLKTPLSYSQLLKEKEADLSTKSDSKKLEGENPSA